MYVCIVFVCRVVECVCAHRVQCRRVCTVYVFCVFMCVCGRVCVCWSVSVCVCVGACAHVVSHGEGGGAACSGQLSSDEAPGLTGTASSQAKSFNSRSQRAKHW